MVLLPTAALVALLDLLELPRDDVRCLIDAGVHRALRGRHTGPRSWDRHFTQNGAVQALQTTTSSQTRPSSTRKLPGVPLGPVSAAAAQRHPQQLIVCWRIRRTSSRSARTAPPLVFTVTCRPGGAASDGPGDAGGLTQVRRWLGPAAGAAHLGLVQARAVLRVSGTPPCAHTN